MAALAPNLRDPAQIALAAAVAAGLGLAAVWLLAFQIPQIAKVDAEAYRSFVALQRPSLIGIEQSIVDTVGPPLFGVTVPALAIVALMRRRPKLVPAIAVILLGSNLSTEVLKHVLPGHTIVLPGSPLLAGGSFPSGHATACMSLVLCAVLVVPAGLRVPLATAGAGYALLVGCSVLVMASHYPSDVIGGFLMAALWTLAAIVVLQRGSKRARPVPNSRTLSSVTPLASVASIAIAASGVAIAVGPKEVSPVPLAAVVTVIALVAAASVGAVAELAELLGPRAGWTTHA